jgi:hypothetical protein
LPARPRRLRRANSAPMSLVAPTHAERRRNDRAPLLRFCPLQRSLARDALSTAARLWTIPLRRFLVVVRPARPRKDRSTPSPVRFYALRIRCGEARRAEVPIAFRTPVRAAWTRRLNVLAMSDTSSIVRAEIGRCNQPVLRRSDPSHQAPPLRLFAARS